MRTRTGRIPSTTTWATSMKTTPPMAMTSDSIGRPRFHVSRKEIVLFYYYYWADSSVQILLYVAVCRLVLRLDVLET